MIKKSKIVFFICLAVFIVAVIFVIKYNQTSLDYVSEAISSNTSGYIETSETCPINFKEKKNLNSDIYAWICIPDTNIDYPILQSDDDSYYLTHTVNGEEMLPGSIYTEKVNNKNFTDKNTLIYGHNMKDGSMFGSLSDYKDSSFRETHSDIYIYLPDKILKYKVFFSVTYDDRHIMKSFDFSSDKGLKKFIDSFSDMKDFSNYTDSTVSISENDKIITLSTCTQRDDQRFLIGAILVDEQKCKIKE